MAFLNFIGNKRLLRSMKRSLRNIKQAFFYIGQTSPPGCCVKQLKLPQDAYYGMVFLGRYMWPDRCVTFFYSLSKTKTKKDVSVVPP